METHHEKERPYCVRGMPKTVITIGANAFDANIHVVDDITQGRKLLVILKWIFWLLHPYNEYSICNGSSKL